MYSIMYIYGGEKRMLNTNATNFRKNLFGYLEQAIKFNEPLNVSTKDGNVVVLNEDDYRGIMETIYLSSSPQMRAKLLDGKNAPLEDCVPESEVEW